MNTETRLMLIYGNTHIPLSKAREDYLPHLSEAVAKRKANSQSLPWPVVNSDPDSHKSTKFVSIKAIAQWLDEKEKEANEQWQKVHS